MRVPFKNSSLWRDCLLKFYLPPSPAHLLAVCINVCYHSTHRAPNPRIWPGCGPQTTVAWERSNQSPACCPMPEVFRFQQQCGEVGCVCHSQESFPTQLLQVLRSSLSQSLLWFKVKNKPVSISWNYWGLMLLTSSEQLLELKHKEAFSRRDSYIEALIL